MEYIPAKHIVIRNKSTAWFGSDHTMNIYKGCCHGCIYCDSRSECYGVEDFDRVRAKENAMQVIRDDLRSKVRSGIVGTGSMSDPYNPFEKELLLTRHGLELIDAYEFGVAIATKSDLITRDIDILQSIKSHSPVLCKLTVTTTDDVLAGKLEPNVASPTQRLAAIKKLSDAGIFTGVLLMPTLPFLEDSVVNVLSVVEGAARAGAKFVYPAFGMTMRQNQREYYLGELERRFPGQGLRARYERQYGQQYTCTSPNAKPLWAAFSKRCKELGLLYEMRHIISAYQRGYGDRQLSFFD